MSVIDQFRDTVKKDNCFHNSRQGGFVNKKVLIFFLFLHNNICCGYSLEAPH